MGLPPNSDRPGPTPAPRQLLLSWRTTIRERLAEWNDDRMTRATSDPMDVRRLIAGVGVGADATDLAIDLGALHPSSHAAFRLALTLDGDRVTAAAAQIGFMHRGAEKLFEVRDYPAVLALANRHDWLAAFAGELGAALAVEELLGVTVPPRAVWVRTLLAELTRISSHLAFLAAAPGVPAEFGWGARESIQQLITTATGGHLHTMAVAIGGLRADITDDWLAQVKAGLPERKSDLDSLTVLIEPQLSRLRGLGVLDLASTLDFGVSGPMARAAGSTFDVRTAEPYLAYGELADDSVLRVPTRNAGDAAARYEILLEETAVSLDLIEHCVARLQELHGPVGIRLPKVIRVPEGQAVTWTETPLGACSWLLVSTGDKVPWRLKIKAPSFAVMAAMSRTLVDVPVAELGVAIGSCFFVTGDADR
jgi:NADH-quinone oxidoreductase subunit D